MFYLGIDIGSLSCDAVLLDHNNQIMAQAVVPTGARNQEAITIVRNAVIQKAGIAVSKFKQRFPQDMGVTVWTTVWRR